MKNSTVIDARYQAIRDFYNGMKELGVQLPDGFDSWMQQQDVVPVYDCQSGKIISRMILANETRYNE